MCYIITMLSVIAADGADNHAGNFQRECRCFSAGWSDEQRVRQNILIYRAKLVSLGKRVKKSFAD